MLNLLAQITVTFITIGISFITAYAFYLSSCQANINAKIQEEANLLKDCFDEYPVGENPFNYSYLLNDYRKIFPNKTRLELLNRIGNDLMFLHNCQFKKAEERLSVFWKDQLPFKGRIYLYLIYEYFETTLMNRHKSLYGFSGAAFRDYNQKGRNKYNGFPYTLYGIKSWLAKFKNIKTSYYVLRMNEKFFLEDVENFIKKSDQKWFEKFNYEGLLDNTFDLYKKIIPKVDRIEGLIALKESYSIKYRLPDISWIIFLFVLSFLLGVVFPLFILSFNIEMPSIVNIIVLIIVFVPLCGGIPSLIYKNYKKFDEKDFVYEYIMPIEKQLEFYCSNDLQYSGFSYENINSFITETEKSIPKKLLKLLKSYRKLVEKYNNLAEKVIPDLANNLKEDTIVSIYKDFSNSGGVALFLVNLLANCKDIQLKKDTYYIFNSNNANISTDYLKIKTPSNTKKLNTLIQKINIIVNDVVAKEDTKKLISTHKKLKEARIKLLNYLKNKY